MRPFSSRSIRPTLTAVCQFVLCAASLAVATWPASAAEQDEPGTTSDAVAIVSTDAATVDVQVTTGGESAAESTANAETTVSPGSSDGQTDTVDHAALATPTHHQTGIIKVNVDGLPNTRLTCFCLTPEGRILAGCAGEAGEIRVFDGEGNYLESWSAPVKPEAMYVRADGVVFLAGEGQLARLSPAGNLELQNQSPHAAGINEHLDQIRDEVISQAKQRAEMYAQQAAVYDQMIQRVDGQIAAVKEKIAALEQPSDDAPQSNEQPAEAAESGHDATFRRFAGRNRSLEQQLTMLEQMKKQYEEAKSQWAEFTERNPAEELTEEQIEEQVKSALQYKLQTSSISATDDEVFLATHAAIGYTFDVWRMDDRFENGERIVSNLSGCCGQMDVKVNDNGLFVAENSRHHVCRYDREGQLICKWGQSARSGLEGFGSCCNPMNVAFGADGSVYTGESETGRIKRYSPEGRLLGLVGASELVPGCNNVSIAINADGSRVYMLDITRNHIVRMEPYAPGQSPGPMYFGEQGAEGAGSEASQSSATGAENVFVKILTTIFGGGE